MRNCFHKLIVGLILAGLLTEFFCFAGAEESPSPAEAYKKRREALAGRLKEEPGVALVFAASDEDLEEPLQNNDFYYLTGVDTLGAVLMINVDSANVSKSTLFLPSYDPGWERWNGPRLSAKTEEGANEKLAGELGMDSVDSLENFSARLHRALHRGEPRVWTLWDSAPLDEPLGKRLQWIRSLREHYPEAEFKNLAPHTEALRLVKDAFELALLRRAMEVTAEGYRAALKVMRLGAAEFEMQAEMEAAFRRNRAGRAFPSIVASGPNATVLHYMKNDRAVKKGEMVLFDVGARVGSYCADISRTFPVDGKFSKRQREIYTLVYEAQQKGIAAVKPGATISQVDAAARIYLKEKGFDFPHGTSHYVGLDVHDVGGRDVPFVPGVVLTVEPGIYLDEEGIGVRIEDTVLVTEAGCEVLSRHIPSAPGEVENFLRKLRGGEGK
jgi:Xaa-Pro aminopeptidase